MLNLTIVDNDRWVVEGVKAIFCSDDINIHVAKHYNDLRLFKDDGHFNMLITELVTAENNIEAVFEYLKLIRFWSPDVRIVILTSITEIAVLKYINIHLPDVQLISKKDSIESINAAFFSYCSANQLELSSLSLTHKEFQMMRWLNSKSSLKEIAFMLNLSVKTISHHKKNIERKLGCSNKYELYRCLTNYGY